MTLDEFVKESHEDIERFLKMWRDGQKENHEMFPDTMNPGDWFDQFMGFVSGNGEQMMTKSQIKAELRRSACEDDCPYEECQFSNKNWHDLMDNFRKLPEENVGYLSTDNCRTFFLLVAEAL